MHSMLCGSLRAQDPICSLSRCLVTVSEVSGHICTLRSPLAAPEDTAGQLIEPTYCSRLEVNERELPVMPLSINEAVAVAHAILVLNTVRDLQRDLLTLPSCCAAPSLPLEILQANSFEPTYRSRLEVNAGELPVLPLSIYGAVAMAHAPDSLDGEASGNAFFLHKFVRSSSGLAGLRCKPVESAT